MDLQKEIDEATQERDKFLEQAQNQINAMNYHISRLEDMFRRTQAEEQPAAEENQESSEEVEEGSMAE